MFLLLLLFTNLKQVGCLQITQLLTLYVVCDIPGNFVVNNFPKVISLLSSQALNAFTIQN
jgi:hypothetical protein